MKIYGRGGGGGANLVGTFRKQFFLAAFLNAETTGRKFPSPTGIGRKE